MADGSTRLDDAAVAAHLSRADELLEQVEAAPGPTARAAIEAVRDLTALYGEALARVLDHADGELTARMADDDLVGHLLVLHGLHPEPVERRVARAVDGLRPVLRERGGDIALDGVDGGVARVSLTTTGCGSTWAGVEDAVRETLLAAAPELSGVERAQAPADARPPAFVPLDALTHRAARSGEPA
ncbi:NifU family protein [Streptomyces sp. TRM64462]|uniref:NifU family protein n=1 Tax=Streptomyces sp. TRM64462 TaxID=2741726 RepID=UPI0015864223|nr:NifU family protein [Streptomyces sp. TRM64462]